ncbi:MAG: hypothetical protein ABFC86_03520, partial [Rectinema sp.]
MKHECPVSAMIDVSSSSDSHLPSHKTSYVISQRSHLGVFLVILLIAIAALSLFIGRYPKPGIMNPALLGTDSIARQIVLNSRLPR